MKRLLYSALFVSVFAVCMSIQAQTVKRTYNDFEQYPCKLNEWNKASGSIKNSTDIPEGVSAKSSMEMTSHFSGKGFEHFAVSPLNGNIPGNFKSSRCGLKTLMANSYGS